MKIRARFMISVTAVMAITFLIILLCLLFARANHALSIQQEECAVGARLLGNICNRFSADNSFEDNSSSVRTAARILEDSGLLKEKWTIKDSEGNIISGNLGKESYYTVGVSFKTADSSEYTFFTGIDREMFYRDISDGLEAVIAGMAVGTIFLAGVVYLLTSRLVLDPVLRILAMTRVMKHGGKPGDNRLSQRKDEIGELINSFAEMSREVDDKRKNLQKKINEAAEKIEKAQKELAFKDRLSATGKLASGVAHEINNPLAGIINAVKALQKPELAEGRRIEYFGLITEGLERIRDIVSQILFFARKEPMITETDIFVCMKKAIDLCRHRIDNESVVLKNLCEKPEFKIMADPGELQQVFLNLLVNALDAVSENTGEKIISIIFESDSEFNTIIVEDNGMGLEQNEIEKSFELFHTTKQTGRGSGLGLSISNDIITRIGGKLELISEKGCGTKACVSFPSQDTGCSI